MYSCESDWFWRVGAEVHWEYGLSRTTEFSSFRCFIVPVRFTALDCNPTSLLPSRSRSTWCEECEERTFRTFFENTLFSNLLSLLLSYNIVRAAVLHRLRFRPTQHLSLNKFRKIHFGHPEIASFFPSSHSLSNAPLTAPVTLFTIAYTR